MSGSGIGEQLFALNIMSKGSVALYHKFALSVGISDSSLGIMYALSCTDTPCSQYDLCGKWSIPKQTINTSVNALQSKGLVSLTPAAGSRNRKIVSLTAAGKEFAEKTVRILLDAELAALSELSPEERELYIRLNQKYNVSLTEKLGNYLKSSGSDRTQNSERLK